MEKNRREFLKKMGMGAAVAASVPILSSCGNSSPPDNAKITLCNSDATSTLIVPPAKGLQISGTFLDEISHDIPHQNWGEKEWDQDFCHMKAIGIDTVIMIRSGYRKFITYPSEYLIKKGCYKPSVDLLDMYLKLADKHGMKFYFGLYDSGHYWATGDMSHEIEDNKYVIDEVWQKYGQKYKSFQGWYLSGGNQSGNKGSY